MSRPGCPEQEHAATRISHRGVILPYQRTDSCWFTDKRRRRWRRRGPNWGRRSVRRRQKTGVAASHTARDALELGRERPRRAGSPLLSSAKHLGLHPDRRGRSSSAPRNRIQQNVQRLASFFFSFRAQLHPRRCSQSSLAQRIARMFSIFSPRPSLPVATANVARAA